MAITYVETESQTSKLAAYLQGKRRKPVVVVSSTRSIDDSWISVHELDSDLGGLADVYWMQNGDLTWLFAKLMPSNANVFGEAGRVYRVNNEWIQHPRKARLYVAFNKKDGAEIVASLSAEALHDASVNGLVALREKTDIPVKGVVKQIVAGRGIAETTQGLASIVPELVLPGIQAENLIQVGQSFDALFNEESRQLNLSPSKVTAKEALSHYCLGDVINVKVEAVSKSQATLELFPGVRVDVKIGQITGNPLDSAYDLMSKGEIVRARINRVGPSWLISMSDVDDDEIAVAAPTLLAGGPPLYVVEEHEFVPPARDDDFDDDSDSESKSESLGPELGDDDPADEADTTPFEQAPEPTPPAPVRPHPGMFDPARKHRFLRHDAVSPTEPAAIPVPDVEQPPIAQAPTQPEPRIDLGAQKEMVKTISKLKTQCNALTEEVQQLRTRALALQEKNNENQAELKRLRTAQRKAVQQAKQDARTGRSNAIEPFADAEQQFRHDVYMVWVEKIPAQDKARLPLPDYAISSHFLETLHTHTPDIRKKALEVAVEILTGTAERSAGRDVHPLRGGSPTAPPVTRNNGQETCMRVAVKIGAPSAPRFHYWKGAAQLELSSVRLHDDMQP